MDQQATRTKPRSYTEDYKRQVVDLVVGGGRTPTAVAGEVGLHPTLLCRWVRQYSAGGSKTEAPQPAAASSLKPLPVPTADCGSAWNRGSDAISMAVIGLLL